ncbi:dockerin type I domain-containing protein [Hungatella hathewayi]|uniref:dockerin type I domain-containing protein n=1 Tax=Hungatella hathewayi TaxID=154046 RepID=UPI0035622B1A
MINKNTKLERKQYFWLLKITVMLTFAITFLFNIQARAASGISVITSPSGSISGVKINTDKTTVNLVTGDKILQKLPKNLTYSVDGLDFVHVGYAMEYKQAQYGDRDFVEITENTTYTDPYSMTIYSLWRLKSWDEYGSNGCKYEDGTYKILKGHLNKRGDTVYKEKLGEFYIAGQGFVYKRDVSSNYYPWNNGKENKIIINEGVRISNQYALSFSKGTINSVIINSTNFDELGTSTSGKNTYRNYYNTTATIYGSPQYYDQIQYFFGETKLDNKGNPYFTGTAILVSEETYSFGTLLWNYQEDSKTLNIMGKGDMPNSGYPWTGFLQSQAAKVSNIIIGNEVTSIGNNAFSADPTISNITIGTNVKKIGSNAFNCGSTLNIFNAATSNQTIGSNAFQNMNSECNITYVPANVNFINYMNGKAGSSIVANANGYVEIANGNDWTKYLMASGGYGRYEITSDFSFKGRVSIEATYVGVYDDARNGKNENSYYKYHGYKVYDNYEIKPMIERYREWPLYTNDFDITGRREASMLDFHGELIGNGHKITNVNYGLFNDNYGTISNLVVENSENQYPPVFGTRNAMDDEQSSYDMGYYESPDYIASIASTNYGTIDSVEIEGKLSATRVIYMKQRDGSDYYWEIVDGKFNSGGVAGVNAESGVIRKCHVTGNIRGINVGGICYENKGLVYGCSTEGQIYGEGYNHNSTSQKRTQVNQESVIGGICVNNEGTVEQCFGASQILGFVYTYRDPGDDDEPSSADVPNTKTKAAGLIVTNDGIVRSCSTEGYLNLADGTYVRNDYDGNYSTKYTALTTDFARYILENNGSVNQGFAGAGFRYTRNYKNPSQINYSFKTSAYGNNSNFYSLQNEKYIDEYDAGYIWEDKSTYRKGKHSCQITTEDYISDAAKQNVTLEFYSNKTGKSETKEAKYIKHNHDNAFCGIRITSANAKGANSSNVLNGLSKSEWTFSQGNYPRPKDSLKIHVENVTGRYLGDAVEGTSLDKSKIEFIVYYSDGSVYKTTGSSSDFTFPYGLYIANVGTENVIYFKYNDSRLTGMDWPEANYGTFTINARERLPIDILKVEYSGTPITENMNYSPSNIRVTILFDNGTQSTYLGSSNNVGITTKKNTLGDLDGNGVVNQKDYSLLKQFLSNGTTTLTAAQRKEADINKDGQITVSDLSELSDIISKKVPFDRKTFYVKFSGIDFYKSLSINSVKRKINGISISATPDKVKYIEGENFEAKGMVITIKYDNGESQTLYFENGDETFDGLSLGSIDYPIKRLIKDQDRIPITYSENGSKSTAWLNISVRQVYLTSIVITQEPNIKLYYSGESFDSKGMKITAYYDEGVYTDGRDKNYSRKEEIPLNKCRITGGSKLIDSTSQLLVKADQITNANRDMKGFVKIQKNSVISPNIEALTVGYNGTIQYAQDTLNKTIKGTVVGNNYITVAYTEGGVTRNAIQPIVIEKKKLTKIDVYQQPHKTEYVEGDLFDASGLIVRAYYTDGTSEFIYQKNETNANGFEVINGDQPLPIIANLTIKYTNNGTSAITTIPITVTRNDIERIEASYTGPKVDLGEKFTTNFVLINVVFKNGNVESFYADKLVGGNLVVDLYKKGTHNKDYQLHDSGDNVENVNGEYINHYTAIYAGLSADFTVTGIKTISQIDFSGSVAQGRRDASEWTEEFRSIKVKTVYDYINQYAKTGDYELSDIDGKDGDGINPAAKIDPLQWFEREGDWIEPVTNFVIEYKTRTNGFLFPETGKNEDGSIKYDAAEGLNISYFELPYLNKFHQDRLALRNPVSADYKSAGWSDWVRNGDSAGTANAKRIAFDYTDANPDEKAKTTYIGSAKFRLNTLNGYHFQADENPQILIYVNGNTSHPYTVTKTNEVEIENIQTMKMVLSGKVRVRDTTGVEQLHDFSEIYKVGYKIGTSNEPYNWTNEWVGVDGISAECFEVKIQLSTAPIDDFSFAALPFIAAQPEDVSAVLGTRAIYTVKSVGQNMTYQWHKIDAKNQGDMSKSIPISGATKYFYETQGVTLNDDRSTYYCIITNGSGSTTSSQAMLYVVDKLPEITGNIDDISIESGEKHTFSIAATCENPSALKYQWEMTNKNGEWEVVKAQSADNTFEITASENTHNKYIRCKITNTRGSVYSHPARIAMRINPEVTITASKLFANLGETITFTSYATSYAGILEYSWYVKDLNDSAAGYTLQDCTDKIFEYTETDAGEYKIKCIVKDNNGYSERPNEINWTEHDKNAVDVKVGNPPKIKSITYNIVKTGTATVDIGVVNKYKATFTADVNASNYTKSTLSYQWYKNGQLINGATEKTLTLTNLDEKAQMTILCKISDLFGNDYFPIELTITPATDIVIK